MGFDHNLAIVTAGHCAKCVNCDCCAKHLACIVVGVIANDFNSARSGIKLLRLEAQFLHVHIHKTLIGLDNFIIVFTVKVTADGLEVVAFKNLVKRHCNSLP